jgi:glyoxalase family protein
MNEKILGLHHVTAIAGDAQRNYDFYTQVMGLRLIKKTVNFDDPSTYHFYFGDYEGTPGTILTFFPWSGMLGGMYGTGEAAAVSFSVPEGSLDFWIKRLSENGIKVAAAQERFGQKLIRFSDPDGMGVELIIAADTRPPYVHGVFTPETAVRGFHNVTLRLTDQAPTAEVLTGLFGYTLLGQEGEYHRYATGAVAQAATVDILVQPSEKRAVQGTGSIHHVAFRVSDDQMQLRFRRRIVEAGFHITPQIDRDYFHSLYFRERGGVLFEIATDNPGFTVDEPLESLGSSLRLPRQHEPQRQYIERVLPELKENRA